MSRIAPRRCCGCGGTSRRAISGIYNLGTGEARSFLDLMHALGAACGMAPKIEFVDMPEAIRPNYQYFTAGRA